MYRKMFRSKIHRATVTDADLHYEGSCTIDRTLMEMADILPYQDLEIWNVTNGERLSTYAIPGQPGSGVICMNGAAAHKMHKGDMVIIATFGWMMEDAARQWEPTVILVDEKNRPVEQRAERAGQADVTQVAWN